MDIMAKRHTKQEQFDFNWVYNIVPPVSYFIKKLLCPQLATPRRRAQSEHTDNNSQQHRLKGC
jgi:hypothetical protein